MNKPEKSRRTTKALRVDDFHAYVRELGLSPQALPGMSLYGTKILHRGQHVGNFFLSDKDGGRPFTEEDEEILVLFASHAAAAIANARTHRHRRPSGSRRCATARTWRSR